MLSSIVYKPASAEPNPDGYTRVALEQAELVAGYGIAGDTKGGGTRNLNILSADAAVDLAADGFRAAPGKLGEQLTIRDLAVDELPAGTVLQIGKEARVEVVEPRRGCAKFEQHQGQPRERASGRLGIMAKVVAGGPIRIGDPVVRIDG